MAGAEFISNWMKAQKPMAPQMKNAPAFYRGLEESLDVKRASHAMFPRVIAAWKSGESIDFCSNDLLSMGKTGKMRVAFLAELAKHPDFAMYAGGTRIMDGNYEYLEQTEQEVADFHGAESALMVNSGWEANTAIYTAIPRPGDVIVYDELVHASTHDAMAHSLAASKVPFRHNDVDAYREALASAYDSHPMIRDGSRCVIISVESVYSMDGDVCPLEEFIEISKEIFPKGNAIFVVDEAHATGILGPKGAGLVSKLGLEKEIAVRLHTCGKALASSGAFILGSQTVRRTLINYARCVIYTTAPSFPSAAAVRSGYGLLRSGATEEAQARIQFLVKYFFKTITSNPVWEKASETGILAIPVADDWENTEWHAHIVPLWTRQRYNWFLVFHLQLAGISALPVDYPTVPKGQGRIRLMFHAANTEAEVDHLAKTVCDWAQEMIDIESGVTEVKIPVAAQQAYALMAM
ncbi:5-aminolevulinate synthase [Zymoseptoria tritici IPO323]|uniref:5-aminolevulinate synthase n=1 Tax=Zymoseptoria tritici (strain CBS 115943 / IPO323) TaxID=336722 RepID=F9XLZ4_ZYMTI|nr:5-aminolevulinate synthase [Zymoseptoria tritici IPO323]EGP84004.1 5-aminolevulinate synthase [Zymoseptoria tritici IPO323]